MQMSDHVNHFSGSSPPGATAEAATAEAAVIMKRLHDELFQIFYLISPSSPKLTAMNC